MEKMEIEAISVMLWLSC